jgi:hypothetical protein
MDRQLLPNPAAVPLPRIIIVFRMESRRACDKARPQATGSSDRSVETCGGRALGRCRWLDLSKRTALAAVLNEADCSGTVSEEFISGVERQNALAIPASIAWSCPRTVQPSCRASEVHGLAPSAMKEPPLWIDVRALLSKLPLDGLPSHLAHIRTTGRLRVLPLCHRPRP